MEAKVCLFWKTGPQLPWEEEEADDDAPPPPPEEKPLDEEDDFEDEPNPASCLFIIPNEEELLAEVEAFCIASNPAFLAKGSEVRAT